MSFIISVAAPKDPAAKDHQIDLINLTCAANHLACFCLSSYKGIAADLALPCEICGYNKDCKFDWNEKMCWIFKASGVKVSPRDVKDAIARRGMMGHSQ